MKIENIEALETYGVRHPVLRAGRPVEDCAMEGDDLETTFHLGAFDGDLNVGVATFLLSKDEEIAALHPHASNYYQLRGMAVVPDHQGRGVGKQLLQHGISLLQKRSVQVLWFNARIKAVPFYERLGFEKTGAHFEVGSIGTHYKMHKEL